MFAGRAVSQRLARQRRRDVQDGEMLEIDPLVQEMLLSDPDLVAWLTPHDDEIDEDEPAAAA
jgi:hypothetical protein